MMPLYGFLEGDTIGLLILTGEHETIEELARKLQQAAAIRVAERPVVRVLYKERELDPHLTIKAAGIQALDRFDVVGPEIEEGG